MFVRSQDKEVLGEFNFFEISKNVDGGYNFYGNKHCIGFYLTKEKAMKVLDMIEKRLNDGTQRYSKVMYYSKENSRFLDYDVKNYVFHMPQDSEVE